MKMHDYVVSYRAIGGKRLLTRKEKAGSVRAALSQFMSGLEFGGQTYGAAVDVVAIVRVGWPA